MEGSMEGDMQEAKRDKDLCHDTSGCGADLSKWTSNEGGFRPRDRR